MTGPVIVVDPTQLWNDTGMDMEKDRTYHLVATSASDKLGRPYRDDVVPADADGVHGFFGWLFNAIARNPFWTRQPNKQLRVLDDRYGNKPRFLTLMGIISNKQPEDADIKDNTFTIGSALILTSPATGRLYVFANDWLDKPDDKGSGNRYGNNKGLLLLQIRETTPDP